jgi:hypothetical protein
MRYQPDHAFLCTEKALAVFVALGVPGERLVRGSRAGLRLGQLIIGETKCCAGFLVRGDPTKDVLTVADAGH